LPEISPTARAGFKPSPYRLRHATQPVDAVLVEPKESIGNQKASNLRTPAIEDERIPLRLIAQPWVRMFVQIRIVANSSLASFPGIRAGTQSTIAPTSR
jgi:hypothetical protein